MCRAVAIHGNSPAEHRCRSSTTVRFGPTRNQELLTESQQLKVAKSADLVDTSPKRSRARKHANLVQGQPIKKMSKPAKRNVEKAVAPQKAPLRLPLLLHPHRGDWAHPRDPLQVRARCGREGEKEGAREAKGGGAVCEGFLCY